MFACRIQDSKTIPATYISQDLEASNISWKWSTTAEHLNIYIPDDSNLEKSIDYFVKLYSMRTRSDREHWLLDVSSLVNIGIIPDEENDSSLNNAIENLKDLPLDLDDDLFFYSHDNHHHSNNNKKDDNNLGAEFISIWEFYEIHPSRPRKLKPYGQWNSSAEKQLSLTKESKWNRRRDLEVYVLSD